MRGRLLAVAALVPLAALTLSEVATTGGPAGATTYQKMSPYGRHLVSGFASAEYEQGGTAGPTTGNAYHPVTGDDCPVARGTNVKTNQNCLNVSDPDLQGRAQAQNETSIAADPNNPNHLVASYNDYRRGDGNCYSAFSTDGGQTWSDVAAPMSFTRGATSFGSARQYWQAGGDTEVGWDTKGNAYLQCQVFNRGAPPTSSSDQSSAIYIFRSTGNNGASFNFPGRPVVEFSDHAGTAGALEDKPFMTVDDHVGSPNQDRIYVTWTEFIGSTADIYESYSSDYGEHFSPRVLVSADSAAYCNGPHRPISDGGDNTAPTTGADVRCSSNQFSEPFTGPDGTLYVVWANYNNPVAGNDNRNQILEARSTDGGASFGAPIKVTDFYDLPDCATYQGADAGRACVPEKGATTRSVFRATNYPVGEVNPANPSTVAVSIGSYINRHSNEANGCVPAGFSGYGNNLYTGVKKPGACNNDILVSVSNDGGTTFSGQTTDPRNMATVTSDPRQDTTDQFWQWQHFAADGTLVVSYMDRQYGNDEYAGDSDQTVSASKDFISWSGVRATTSSMPPPTQFSGVFYGDYQGLALAGRVAHPLWSDTRDKDLFVCPAAPGTPPSVCTMTEPNGLTANDQNAYTTGVGVPAPPR